jgi:hypothetical protein
MSRLAFRALAVWWARRSPPRLSSWHYSGHLIFLRALGVLGGQKFFGLSAVIDGRYNVSGGKFSEIFLKPAPLQPMPDCVMVAQVWKHKLNE